MYPCILYVRNVEHVVSQSTARSHVVSSVQRRLPELGRLGRVREAGACLTTGCSRLVLHPLPPSVLFRSVALVAVFCYLPSAFLFNC